MYEYALLPHLNIFSFDLLDYHYEEIRIFSENFDHNFGRHLGRVPWTNNSSGVTVQEALVDNRLKNN